MRKLWISLREHKVRIRYSRTSSLQLQWAVETREHKACPLMWFFFFALPSSQIRSDWGEPHTSRTAM